MLARRSTDGEHGRNRTYNLRIKSPLLCQLSYVPTPMIESSYIKWIPCGYDAGWESTAERCDEIDETVGSGGQIVWVPWV